MPLTDIQICNMALGHIGHTKFLADLAERSNEANVVNNFYSQAVEMTLESYPWPEATKYGTLGLVEEDPNDDWDYLYQYPSDCLYARRIVTMNGKVEPNPPPFITGYSESGRVIYTDEEDAVLEYTLRLEDPSLFRPTLGEAISWYLAFLIGPGLAKDQKLTQGCFQVWQAMTSRAQQRAGNEQQHSQEIDSEAIRSRS